MISLSSDLESVEGKVERYKKNNRISSTSEKDIEIVLEEVSKYTESQTELEVQMNILSSMESHIYASGKFDLIPSNLSISSTTLMDMITPYNELVLKRQHLLETATASNPMVLSSEQQLISLRNTIQTTIENIKKDLRKQLTSVENLNKELVGKIKKVPTQERGLLEIKRQQVVKENLYLYLLKQKEETALTLASTTSNARVIDAPRTTQDPVGQLNIVIYLGGVLGGLFLPFFLITGKNLLKNTIESEEDIKSITSCPIIGTINKSKKKQKIVVLDGARTAIAEQFKLIRTNLKFAQKQDTMTILVTSSISQEGKSFTALNLALSFALLKKRTIIIDLDLRKPTLKDKLKANSSLGVSDFLAKDAQLKNIIQTSELDNHLDYILSGHIPSNPNELLSGSKISELFGSLRKMYEFIIIDSPPVGLVSDAFLLNDYVSKTLYVAKAKFTKKRMIEDVNSIIKSSKLKNVSIILNGVSLQRKYGYSSYGYGEHNGYYEN